MCYTQILGSALDVHPPDSTQLLFDPTISARITRLGRFTRYRIADPARAAVTRRPLMDEAVFPRNFLKSYPQAVRGEGCFIYTSDGQRYLDAAGGGRRGNTWQRAPRN